MEVRTSYQLQQRYKQTGWLEGVGHRVVWAIIERLYLAPARFELAETLQVMPGLPTLRPSNVQTLLESRRTVKVTRLFLFMAEEAERTWVKHLDRTKVDLGCSKRSYLARIVVSGKVEVNTTAMRRVE